ELNELVRDLLLFARAPRPRFAKADLRLLLEGARDLLARDRRFDHVVVDIAGDPTSVEADGELLGLAFHNILINAAQAMNGAGMITVSISADGDRCVVVLRDSGPGMPPDVLSQVFRPFFTTKARGTGLGLATVRRLVEAHRGKVDVTCPAGGGTVVRI